MSATTSATTGSPSAAWQPNDRFLIGVVLAVITFWLFAQTLLNIIPGIRAELGLELTIANLAVSITSLFAGIFIVVFGKLADLFGRLRMLRTGILLSLLGSLLIALTPEDMGALTAGMMLGGRVVQGLSSAMIMPSALGLLKTFYDGAARQRAMSFFSIGTWGGSGLTSLFGGFVATALGWRSIFWISIAVALIALLLLRGTPESKAPRSAVDTGRGFDWGGLIAFIVALLALNVYISQGPTIGWLSPAGIGLIALTVISTLVFFLIETRRVNTFIDLTLFRDRTFSGAVLSNFLINGAAGTLIVVLGLTQMAAGFSALQSGMLTIGYLVAILATIRVGERLLQLFGPRRPMMWGACITGAGVLLCSMTFLLIEQYVVAAVIGFTLFGIGLGFYATPSLDAAMSNVPDSQAGAAGGLYKMASSLGNAMGVAASAALYAAGQRMDPAVIQSWGIFIGNQENVSLRFGGAIGLLFNVLIVAIALTSIIITVPKQGPQAAQGQGSASQHTSQDAAQPEEQPQSSGSGSRAPQRQVNDVPHPPIGN